MAVVRAMQGKSGGLQRVMMGVERVYDARTGDSGWGG
jgi:hypothetical protein